MAKISDAEDKTDYIQFLRIVYKVSVDASGVKSLLKKIEKWYNYRNEIVHSMFHKDIDELRNGYKKHVEEGFEMARFLDNQVKSLRRA
ncbi:hypothetical protein [Lachnospira multipara]|uniref:hypothetical protein n=1 Tax=Lachnospira multipara TaxID=28051 RepID=UPI0004E20966|nr:hypothetical protein [Lachnospira multipara]